MKSQSLMVVAVLFAFILSLNTIKSFTLEEISLFLTVIGLIYGLVTSFSISSAWERFSQIRDAIAEETNSLTTMYIFSKKITDRNSFKKIKAAILEYCQEVPKIEWKDYWKASKVHKKFRKLIEIVSDIKLKNNKDTELFNEISEELRNAAAARNAQLVISQTRISKPQWILNIFLSGILVLGVISTRFVADFKLSILVGTAMISAVILILVVLYDLDSMKTAEEEVSNEPYREVIKIIKSE